MRFPLSTTRLTLRSFPTKAEVDVSGGVSFRMPYGTYFLTEGCDFLAGVTPSSPHRLPSR